MHRSTLFWWRKSPICYVSYVQPVILPKSIRYRELPITAVLFSLRLLINTYCLSAKLGNFLTAIWWNHFYLVQNMHNKFKNHKFIHSINLFNIKLLKFYTGSFILTRTQLPELKAFYVHVYTLGKSRFASLHNVLVKQIERSLLLFNIRIRLWMMRCSILPIVFRLLSWFGFKHQILCFQRTIKRPFIEQGLH